MNPFRLQAGAQSAPNGLNNHTPDHSNLQDADGFDRLNRA
jgi:hypothetical protein